MLYYTCEYYVWRKTKRCKLCKHNHTVNVCRRHFIHWTATKNNLTFAVTLQTTYNHVSGNTAIDNTTARYHQFSVILMPLINY